MFACVGVYTLRDGIQRHWGAVLLLALMGLWTLAVTIGYSRSWGRRNTRFAIADLVVTIACMVGTLLAQPLSDIHNGASILTSVWAAGPVLALGIARGRDGGVLGALAISAVVLLLRGFYQWPKQIYNVQLLLVAGLVVGYASTTTRRASTRLRDAIAAESAAAERERLSRSIHDGVLQVLAQVQRCGAPDLSALAAEQEVALRNLMTRRPAISSGGSLDLCAALQPLATTTVDVVLPAHPVPLPSHAVTELTAAVSEALANVAEHAGPDARAWVVVEELEGEVLVSVRDDGVGTTADRLAAAAADGQLGVSQSIVGRLEDLGGTATVHTAPGEGTEWEMRVASR